MSLHLKHEVLIADWCGRCEAFHIEGDHSKPILLPAWEPEVKVVQARRKVVDRYMTLGAVAD